MHRESLKYEAGRYTIEYFLKKYGKKKTWEHIEEAKESKFYKMYKAAYKELTNE